MYNFIIAIVLAVVVGGVGYSISRHPRNSVGVPQKETVTANSQTPQNSSFRSSLIGLLKRGGNYSCAFEEKVGGKKWKMDAERLIVLLVKVRDG